MTRQATDQLYIEIGYHTPEEYYVYTAEAQSQQVASSTLSCDAGKITQAQADMVVTTVVTAMISHIEGADLFAFSESQLAAQVDRIRDNNIETSTVFAVSAEVSRIRSLVADQFAISDITVINERSRAFIIETQAAFSLVAETGSIELATADLVSNTTLTSLESATKGFISQLDSISVVTVDVSRIREFDSVQSSTTTVSVLSESTKLAEATLSSTSELQVMISHIEGADLSAFGNSQVTANANIIVNGLVLLAVESTTTVDGQRIRYADSNQQIESSVVASIDGTIESQISLSISSALATDAQRIKPAQSDLLLETTAVIDAQRNRFTESNLVTTSDISCTISHIEGADLSAFGDSQLSAIGQITAERSVAMSSTSVQTTTAIKTARSSVNVQLTSNLAGGPKILDDRTTFVANVGGGFGDIRIVNDQKQFGQGALYIPARNSDVFPYSTNSTLRKDHWIVYNNTIYHIYPGSTYTSTNGTTWTRQSNNIGIADTSYGKIIHTGSQFVFYVPNATASSADTVYTSTDALTWTATTTGSFGTSTVIRHFDIAFFNGYYYVAGTGGGFVRVWRTNNAAFTGWTQVYNNGFTSPNTIVSLQRASNSYVVLAFQSGGAGGPYAYVYRSSNGTTWTYAGPAGVSGVEVSYFDVVRDQVYVLITRDFNGTQYRRYVGDLDTASTGWTTSTIPDGPVRSIEYNATNWVMQTDDAIYYGPSLSNLTVSQTYFDTWKDVISHFVNYNGNFIFFKNDKALYSGNGASYTEYSLSVPANTLPASIEYTSITNDFQTFKTIDFWMRSAAGSSAQSIDIRVYDPENSNVNLLFFGLSNGRFYISGSNASGNFFISSGSNPTVGTGWNHFRIAFDTTSNTGRVWQNGTKLTVSDFTLPAGFSIPNAKVLFYQGGTDDLWIDEFLITDDLLTSTSTNSFTPPTRQWDNTANTDLLLHFNTDFYDDSRYAVIEQANLVSTSAVTASITGTQNAVVSMQVTSTATIQAQKAAEIILSAFGDSQTTADGQRVRYADAALAVTTDISALNQTVKATDAALAFDFQQSAEANITASAEASIEGTTISLTANARTRSGDIQANVESQMITDAAITASAQAQIESISAVSIPGERIRYADSSQNTETAIAADLGLIKRFASDLQSQTVQTVDAVKTVSAVADIQGITISVTALGAIRQGLIPMSIESALAADGVITANGVVNVQSTTDAVINGIIKVEFDADLAATTQVQADNLRVRYSDVALAVETAQNADINYTAFGQSQQASTTEISAAASGTIDFAVVIQATSTAVISANRFRDNIVTAVADSAVVANNVRTRDNSVANASDVVLTAQSARTRPFDAQLVANTIDMFVAVKTGQALADMAVNSQVQATVNIIAYGLVPLAIEVQSSITAVKRSNVNLNFIAQVVIVAEGTTNILGEAQIATDTNLSASATVIYSGAMAAATDTDLTATGVARRGFAFLDQSSGTMTVNADRIRGFSSNFASISIDLIIGDKVVSFNVAMTATSTLTAQGRDIDLAKYVYIIPNEIRTWTIAEENRTRVIKEETRIYKIRRY